MSGISNSQLSRLCTDIEDKVNTFLPVRSRVTGCICGSKQPTKIRQNGRIVSVKATAAPYWRLDKIFGHEVELSF